MNKKKAKNKKVIDRDIVSAVILSKDNKILFGKKDPEKGGVYINCWHIPGGGLRENETKMHALKREIQEEVGINISGHKVSLLDVKGTGESEKILKETNEKAVYKMKFYVYLVFIDENASDIDVNLTDDLIEYKWVRKEEIEDLKLTPPSVSLFKRLGWT